MRLYAAYLRALRRRPLATQAATAGSIAGCGDLIAQDLETRWKAQDSGEQGWDWTRTRAFVAFGCGYTGAVQSVLFRSYERLFPAAPPAAPALSRLRPVLAKLCLNQFVVVPVLYFPLFFASTGLMRGSSAEQAYQAYSERWWPTCLANWGLWLPAQALQFGFVPLQLQVLYVSTVGLVWQTLLSVSANAKSRDDG